ncbi:MAG: hypothetical protein M1825_004060 [Sarcosagium campestre]|nr:MAG: hypothetical protein M1825_004060 [Sarcosagium campestre]
MAGPAVAGNPPSIPTAIYDTTARHASSASASSSDDDYMGVDLISDSDEDEPSVERAEERLIMDSELEGDADIDLTAPFGVDEWDGIHLDESLFPAESSVLDDLFPHANPYFANEFDMLNTSNTSAQEVGSECVSESKRVRFKDDPVHSRTPSTSSSEEDMEPFPDLFMQQDQMDPGFRHIIEHEQEDGVSESSAGEGSYWDFGGSDEHDIHQAFDASGESDDSDVSSSGYESDEGETTDEDLPPPSAIARTRSVLRRPSTSSIDMDGDSSPAGSFRQSFKLKHRRPGPSLGSWVADPSKPIAVLDNSGKRMIIFPAQTVRNETNPAFGAPMSSDSSVAVSPMHVPIQMSDDSDVDQSDFSRPAYMASMPPLSSSAYNRTLGGLLQGVPGNEYLMGGQILGPPEAFYPFMDIGVDGTMQPMEDDDATESDDPEETLNVLDFIDFGNGSSAEEDNGKGNDDQDEEGTLAPPATPVDNAMPTLPPIENASGVGVSEPAALRSETNSANDMLSHFDRGVVTAFRRNQNRHKLLLTRQPIRTLPQFGPSLYHRGIIKGGRFGAVNKPISPRRKQRLSTSSVGASIGVGSRKSTAKQHRRSRSDFN